MQGQTPGEKDEECVVTGRATIITARIAEGCASKIFGKPSAKTGKVAITGDLVSPRFKTLFAGFLAIYWPYFWPFLLYTAGGFLVKMAEILYI